MPDRRGATVLDDLPDDITVGKILILLPPKDIGRCRMVRTSWRSATSTPEFMSKHRRRQPSLPIIYVYDERSLPASWVIPRDAFTDGASTQQLWPFLSRCRKSCCNTTFKQIKLHASSDGFFIVSREDRFYICNPTTRKHALLPFPGRLPLNFNFNFDCNDIHGLYQHKSTGEYRVLWSRVKSGKAFYVLTVGDNESRSIQVVMPTQPSPSLGQTYELILGLFGCLLPVHYRLNLHWLLFRPDPVPGSGIGSTQDIAVFDTEAESFRRMRNPAHDRMRNHRLFDMKGTLAFVGESLDSTIMEVWVMRDYEAEIWAFKYRIDVSMIEASRQLDLTCPEEKRKRKQPLHPTVEFFNEMAVLNELELLVRFNDKHVLRCDTDSKFLGMVNIGKKQYNMVLTGHCLQESIMPIPSGEMQGEDEEFPFSTKHV